jgi:hypothetical protein
MPDKAVRRGILVSPCEYETIVAQQWRYTLSDRLRRIDPGDEIGHD